MRKVKPFYSFLFVLFFLPVAGSAQQNCDPNQQPRLVLPIGHIYAVTSAQFSPDEKKIVTASKDGTAKIWDVESGALIGDLLYHKVSVNTACFSPANSDDPTGGKYILTASDDNTAIIWNALSGNKVYILKGHTDGIIDAKFSPDGKLIVTASKDATVKVWDAASGKLKRTLNGHAKGYIISSFGFNTDGKEVITSSTDGTAIIWDIETGENLHVLKGHRSFVNYAAFSPDGSKAITVSRDKTAILWNAITGDSILALKGHNGQVNFAQFSPIASDDINGGKYIVTASDDGYSKIWDAATGTLLKTLQGHRRDKPVNMARFSPDGKKIVTVSDDATCIIWNAASGSIWKILTGFRNAVISAQFNKNGDRVLTASRDKSAKISETASGKLLKEFTGRTSQLISAEYSPDGSKILTLSTDRARLWDNTSGTLTEVINLQDPISSVQFSPVTSADSAGGKRIAFTLPDFTLKIWDVIKNDSIITLRGHRASINSVQFSPDGKRIVTGSDDKTTILWNAETGKLLFTFSGNPDAVSNVQFSPITPNDPQGGSFIVSASGKTATIWESATGTKKNVLSKHTKDISFLQISPDGKKIVTASQDGTAIIWSTDTGDSLTTLKGHIWALRSAQFSPQSADDPAGGKFILTNSQDSIAKVWDAASGKLLFDLKGHRDNVVSPRFSPDGKKILTGSYDGSVIIWETTSGKILSELRGHKGLIKTARFSPDGNSIITASGDNTCKKWDVQTGKQLYSFFTVDSTDYLIVDSSYHYDGTPAARSLLYFLCGTEVIELNQVKSQLWEPDLAERINKGERITSPTLSELKVCGLTPRVENISDSSQYRFRIIPCSGGLGETILSVNGIELRKYSPDSLTRNGDAYELIISKNELENFFVPGKLNPVTVKSKTADNAVYSRGAVVGGSKTSQTNVTPNLFALIVGIDDYEGTGIDLNYAAKDATDISGVVEAAARKYLDNKEGKHVFIYNLIAPKNAVQTRWPRKNAIRNVLLDSIGRKATATDILFIFFAGHGIVSGTPDKKEFYLLTADAAGFSHDDSIRLTGISMPELIDMMSLEKIKAQTRVMIFDACQSGQAVSNISSNEISDRKKQLEAINDRSGFYYLAASGSDQDANEQSKYAHGLLTYSLLKTIKEQPDILINDLLNIRRWFEAVKDTVTELARAIGKSQTPQIWSPNNFNIGKVDAEVLSKIILAEERPMFSRPKFLNNEGDDDLELSEKIAKNLLVRDDIESANIYSLSGFYSKEGDTIAVKVNFKHKKQWIKFEKSGTNIDDVAAAIAEEAIKKARVSIKTSN